MLGLGLSLGLAPIQGGGVPAWVPRDEAGTPALLAFGPEFGYWYNGVRYPTWAAFAAAVGSVTLSADADGSVRDATGTRVSATADVLRYDHDDTGAPLGWLMEGTSINRFANPLTPATQTITTRSSNRCAVSMKGAGSLTLSGAATGTVTEGAPIYFDAPGSLTVTVSGSVTWVMVDDNPPNRVATSLIQTAGVTRSADVLRFGPSGGLPFAGFSASVGTIVLWGRTCPAFNLIDQVALQLDDGTNNNYAKIYHGNGGNSLSIKVSAGGATQSDIATSVGTNAEFSIAAAWAANDIAISLDGGTELSDTTAAIPSFSTLRFNANASGTDNWGGWVRKVAYFPRRVPSLSARPFFVDFPDRAHLLGDSFASAGFSTALQTLLGNRVLSVDGVGGSSLSSQFARWAATPSLHSRILIMTDDMSWSGESFSSNADMMLVYSQILAQLSGGRFLIMEPGFPIGGVGGSSDRATRDAKWAAIVAAYPDHVVPVTAAMQAAGDGTALDNAYIAADLWPGSCLSNPGTGPTTTVDGHLNSKGNGIYAACAYAAGHALGYWA